jgi:Holliday junction resolvasome RuvABC DNA-binding subunit
LNTQHIVREDGMFLYGFEKLEERDLFAQVSVSAGSVLSGVGDAICAIGRSIQRAVMQEQDEVFSRVPALEKRLPKRSCCS